jgi:hypothetical protein
MRWGRINGGVGVARCNAMNAEHRLRKLIGVQPSTKVGADSNIGVGTLLVEERNPSIVGVQPGWQERHLQHIPR